MSKISWKGGALLAPVPPALVTCGTMDEPNVLTIAWTGIVNTIPPKTYISVRPERFSHPIISKTREFVINLPCESLIKAVDFCGVKSGEKVNKFKEMNLKTLPCTSVSCPQLEESPLSLECRVTDILHLGSHDMFLADIVSVNVDNALLDKNGTLDIRKANLVAYAHGDYYTLGKRLGDFGFSVRKKNKPPKKRHTKKNSK